MNNIPALVQSLNRGMSVAQLGNAHSVFYPIIAQYGNEQDKYDAFCADMSDDFYMTVKEKGDICLRIINR